MSVGPRLRSVCSKRSARSPASREHRSTTASTPAKTTSTCPSSCADRTPRVIELALGCARVVFTDRHGGVSEGPFATMNLAGHVDDDPAAVAENFGRLATALGLVPPARWVRPFHVHGTEVLTVDAAPSAPVDADGSATTVTDLPLVALGADCAPIGLANDTAVAAVHAGWRRRVGWCGRSGCRRAAHARHRAGARRDRPVHLRPPLRVRSRRARAPRRALRGLRRRHDQRGQPRLRSPAALSTSRCATREWTRSPTCTRAPSSQPTTSRTGGITAPVARVSSWSSRHEPDDGTPAIAPRSARSASG